MRESRNISLLPRTTLHSDSEHLGMYREKRAINWTPLFIEPYFLKPYTVVASYFYKVAALQYTFVNVKRNLLLLIRCPFFTVEIWLRLLFTAILNVTKLLLFTTKDTSYETAAEP